MRDLNTWTPIASRSRTPKRRTRITKDGETKGILQAQQWQPIAGAPMTPEDACKLAEEGLLLKALRFERVTNTEYVVIRRVAPKVPEMKTLPGRLRAPRAA